MDAKDQAEQELKKIFNRRGYDRPAIEYPLQLFMDILDWHVSELREAERAARIDELNKVNSHLINLKVAVPALPPKVKPVGEYVLDRIAELNTEIAHLNSQRKGDSHG